MSDVPLGLLPYVKHPEFIEAARKAGINVDLRAALATQRDRVGQARKAHDAEQERLRGLVVAARQSGMSLREVAKLAGISNVSVLNWSRAHRERTGDG